MRVVVEMWGGTLNGIYADEPGVQVVVVDSYHPYENDDEDEDAVSHVHHIEGENDFIADALGTEVNPERVARIFKEVVG